MTAPARWFGPLAAAMLIAWTLPALSQDDRNYPRPLSVNPLYAGGYVLYQHNCAACHGERGDGRGASAHVLGPGPRDFTSGVYKLRSTPSGSLPLDSDLMRTLEQGIPGSAMASWAARLSCDELAEVVKVVKSFSPRFATEAPARPVPIPAAPDRSLELVLHGRDVFARERCNTCHGEFGRGDGPLASGLIDDRGFSIRPHDFTMAGGVKAGARPADLYRSLSTGLDGTPMHDASHLPPDDRWALVYYLMTLSEQPSPELEPAGPHRIIGTRVDTRPGE